MQSRRLCGGGLWPLRRPAALEHLIKDSEQHGFWTLQAGIFPENAVSIALHQRCGFRIVGTRERLGGMNGRWRDILLLERRSPTVDNEPTDRREAPCGWRHPWLR
jgi:hypothetical protein